MSVDYDVIVAGAGPGGSTVAYELARRGVRVGIFGVAGPVVNRRSHITNLPWVIDADAIRQTFDIPQVHLLNDLQASAIAVPHLTFDAICTLNVGQRDPTGAIGVIAPGMGLGEVFLMWRGHAYQSCPTEGGHASFAPV